MILSKPWRWYRARHWVWRILLSIPAILLTSVGLYVLVRLLQYRQVSEIAAYEFVPSTADIVILAPSLEENWPRFTSTQAFRNFQKKALKDKGVRRSLSGFMKDAGLPTLDQLEDRRFVEESGGWLTEEKLLYFLGRDLAVGVEIGDTPEPIHFSAAIKLRFREFLLLPLLDLFPGVAGAKKVTKGALTAYELEMDRTFFIGSLGGVVTVSDSLDLLAAAMQRKGTRPRAEGLLTAEAYFNRRSKVLQQLKSSLKDFPGGLLFSFVNLDPLRSVRMEVDGVGTNFLCTLRAEGATSTSEVEAPVRYAQWAPSNSFWVQPVNTSVVPIWDWFKGVCHGQESTDDFAQFCRQNLGEIVDILIQDGLETQVLSKLDSGYVLLAGAEEIESSKQGPYPAFAVALRAKDAFAAAKALDQVFAATLSKFEKTSILTNEYKGKAVRSFEYPGLISLGGTGVRYKDVLRPCYVSLGDSLVISSYLPFLYRMIDVENGDGPRFLEESLAMGASRRLRALNVNILASSGPVWGFLWFGGLRDGLEGYFPVAAHYAVEADPRYAPVQVRAQIEQEERRLERNPSVSEVDKMVEDRMERLKSEREHELRQNFSALGYAKWLAWGVKPEKDGVALRVVLEPR